MYEISIGWVLHHLSRIPLFYTPRVLLVALALSVYVVSDVRLARFFCA